MDGYDDFNDHIDGDDDASDDEGHEFLAFGRCCVCGVETRLPGVVMLPHRHPVPGKGWGCFRCGLAMDGALAMICMACADAWGAGELALREACADGPKDPGRVPIESLTEEFRHRREFHPEMDADDPG